MPRGGLWILINTSKIVSSIEGVVRTYDVDSKPIYWLFAVVVPVSLVAFGALWIWFVITDASQPRGMVWFGVLWLVATAWGAYRQSTMPRRIEVLESGTIRFVGTLRTWSIESRDVISVRATAGPLMELKHRNGKVLLLRQFTGFHRFVTQLSRDNPNVTVRGL